MLRGVASASVACAMVTMLSCAPTSGGEKRSPNLVVIFVDDAGYGDFGVSGGIAPTPNLDQLARDGAVLTSFHVAQPVCSASRAALLTGCYSSRVGITGALSPSAVIGLADSEVTLAEMLQEQGYATGVFGKWHLGDEPPFMPTEHGFDEFAGLPYSNDMWPTRSADYPPLPFYEGTTAIIEDVQPEHQEQFTSQFTQYATSFIDRHQDSSFFLYLAHPQPHVPLFVSERFAGASGAGLYADVIMEIDWSVGEVVRALDARGLAQDTWVLVTSDNGPWLSYGEHAGSAGVHREGKHTVFEGGVRVPAVTRFPGVIPAGSVIDEPLMTIDLLPTFAALADAELPPHPIDGRDVLSVLAEPGSASPHEAYYFWYGDTLEAVRQGRWKLHFPHHYPRVVSAGADGAAGELSLSELPLSLFDLDSDPAESENLAESFPEVVESLGALGRAHEEAVTAQRRAPGQL